MLADLFFFIGYIFQGWIAVYLLLPFLFLLIYLFKIVFRQRYNIYKKTPLISKDFDFALIITAHKDTQLIPPLVDSLCKQVYGNFHVYVIADACEITNLHFSDPRIVVMKPENDLNSKIKSIDYALNHFVRDHDALVIFDSDNLVHPNFTEVLNLYFQQGFRAVQTNLQAKNIDTLYSRMDAAGDTFYSFTEREIRMELGLSSAIWGLGIAIETKLYKDIIYEHFLGGFDKRIQADIVQRIPQLAFAKEAIVYDEKISSGAALEIQRTRWINAHFKNLALGWSVFFSGIKRLSLNLLLFGFINLRPPLFMVIGLSFLFMILGFIFYPLIGYIWMSIIIVFFVSFFSILAIKSTDKRIIYTIFYMPLFMLRQLLALLKIKRANKSYLKTEHSKVVYIEDLLRNEPA